jgi:hypothetical protein
MQDNSRSAALRVEQTLGIHRLFHSNPDAGGNHRALLGGCFFSIFLHLPVRLERSGAGPAGFELPTFLPRVPGADGGQGCKNIFLRISWLYRLQ